MKWELYQLILLSCIMFMQSSKVWSLHVEWRRGEPADRNVCCVLCCRLQPFITGQPSKKLAVETVSCCRSSSSPLLFVSVTRSITAPFTPPPPTPFALNRRTLSHPVNHSDREVPASTHLSSCGIFQLFFFSLDYPELGLFYTFLIINKSHAQTPSTPNWLSATSLLVSTDDMQQWTEPAGDCLILFCGVIISHYCY